LEFSWADGAQASSSSSTDTSAAKPAAPAPEKKKDEKAAVAQKEYTLSDVAQHKSKDDVWVAINGQVLDVTKFLPDHPGGEKAILLYSGKDASEEFNMIHDKGVIAKYAPNTVIGTLKS